MAVRLRLSRYGRRNRAFFRIVAMDSRVKQKGKYLDMIGWYNPIEPENNFKIDAEKAEKWLKNGALPSDTVRDLLRKAGVEIPSKQRRPDRRKSRTQNG